MSPITIFQAQDEIHQWLQCHKINNITRDSYMNQVTPPVNTNSILVSQD